MKRIVGQFLAAAVAGMLVESVARNTRAQGIDPAQREDRRERRKIARAIAKSNSKLRKGAR